MCDHSYAVWRIWKLWIQPANLQPMRFSPSLMMAELPMRIECATSHHEHMGPTQSSCITSVEEGCRSNIVLGFIDFPMHAVVHFLGDVSWLPRAHMLVEYKGDRVSVSALSSWGGVLCLQTLWMFAKLCDRPGFCRVDFLRVGPLVFGVM